MRSLTLKDVEGILAIDQAVTGVKTKDGDNDLWRLLAETTTCFGVDVGGTLAGFVLADVRPWEFGNRSPVGWIILLGVHPRHQKKGIGHLLGERVLSEFRRLGVSQFKTLVDRENSALLDYFNALGLRESNEVVLQATERAA